MKELELKVQLTSDYAGKIAGLQKQLTARTAKLGSVKET